jgi:transcriptional regulator with GAF, ATPase, and Fis domain
LKNVASGAVSLGPSPELNLTGRQAELSRIDSAYDAALRDRTFGVLVIRGAPGVGRTSLLAAAAQRLSSRGAWVAQAAAPQSREPFALAKRVAEECLHRARPTHSADLLRNLTSRLSTEAPHASLSELMALSARDCPSVFALDDVDAADPASLATLRTVLNVLTVPSATRPADEPVVGGLVLLSARDDAERPELESLVSPWPSLSLAALDLEGVRQFLSRTEAARRAFEATGGLPGRLDALLDSPEPIDFATRRFERLAAAEVSLLRAVALAPAAVDVDFVATVSGRKDVAARLPRLIAARLLTASPASGRSTYSLARERDRSALIDSIPPDERRAMQDRAARSLEARNDFDSAFELFFANGDAASASRTGLLAAEFLANRQAWANAESILSRLLSLPPPVVNRAAALLALASVREHQSDARGALAALGRARPLVSDAERARLRAKAARLCLTLGAPRPAERLARRVLDSESAAAARADALVALAEARFLRGAYDEAIALADSATELPVEHRLLLGNTRGKALLVSSRLDAAHDAFRSNAELAAASGVPNEQVRALLNVGVVAHRQGHREQARAAYRSALLASERSPHAAVVHANLSSLALEEGEAEEALTQAHRALAAFARDGRLKEQAHASQNLALIYLYLGDSGRAIEVATHAESLASRVGDPYLVAGARVVGANAAFVAGDASAEARIAELAEAFQKLGNARYFRESLLLLSEVRLARSDWSSARESLLRAREAGALTVPALASEWCLLDAELQLASDAIDAAAASIVEARSSLVTSPQLELPSRLYWLSGEVAARRGDVIAAQAERLKAARIIDELAAKVPPERRALFLARASRRAILEAAGRAWSHAPLTPSVDRSSVSREPATILIGRSPAMVRLNSLISRLGPSMSTVLLRGESGTGKELAAQSLHANSARKGLPLVAVNCGALSEELLLSELFGHERGAFTGAVREKKGRFEIADGGTIFLDEIGDISPRAQVALLRALQERTFERVGGTRTISVDVRVICATNRNLEDLIDRGLFREDLYYRLRGATLTLPPLRERLDDLPALCEHFLAKQARESGQPPRILSPEAKRLLSRYSWPGNIRELFNVLESALVMGVGHTLGPEAFELFPELFESTLHTATGPAEPFREPATVDPARAVEQTPDFYELLKGRDVSLKDLRRELDIVCISRALGEGNGNISEAARLLKMKRSRLSQIVNAEPELRALCRGGFSLAASGDDVDD